MRTRSLARLFVITLAALAIAAIAGAQTVTPNPSTVQFLASADHNALIFDTTQPVVTRYELRIYVAIDLAKVIATLDLGKPTPATDGTITVTNAIWFAALTPKTKYIGKVAAIGPTGEGVSDPSNPFGNQGPPAAAGTPIVSKK